MAAESESCWSCCFSFILSMGFTAFFIWLSLRVTEPKCYLESIYVPALNKSFNSPHNSTLLFNLKLVNPNKDKGVKYDAVNLHFRIFNDSNTTRPLANATVDRFYQGHQKTAHKSGNIIVTGGGGGGNVTAVVNGKVYFRVEFDTTVKYKILVFYTKHHSLWGGANVEINNSSGLKVYGKPLRLGNSLPRIVSGASKLRRGYRALWGFLVNVLVVLHVLT
ncbi:hypothetical protein TanjilG_11794 [Lupinus angustifolius]|uniref:Late embryogenesis abundant protein LEA-2 subgroup domain-containing protein n=1 Tax=Lupinus angustifolius TaxID=3871 RepID=A0A4P1R6M8_LUPAN|nr:PREDICTED: protein NDR1-like [Lupinus angustifolius]OIW03157.1 hypothetical protein TanjilG_11794 [Lupinus angustifolius]